MNKTYVLLIALLITATGMMGQVAPDKYWVKFTDKNNSPYTIENPAAYLSTKAIQRRQNQNIPIVENDLPVNPSYVQGVADIGVTMINVSKWFNSVTIYTTDNNKLNAINALPYVASVEKSPVKMGSLEDPVEKPFFTNESFEPITASSYYKSGTSVNEYDYGAGYNQINMLNGIELHNLGFDGAGMTIAVLDAGFLNVDNLSAYASLWTNGQILGVKDFVAPDSPNIFDSHYHGAMVLSTMGVNLPGEMVGTAPQADYWLLRSEDGATEYLIEEMNWVSAAEFADSVGADVINSSLGYTTFDDPTQDHTYADMDGNTAPITRGADIASSKGILVVNSAGNSGGGSWQYIGAPADGDSVFSIGAVDGSGNYASFSSTGPTADGRIKPNVVAQGQGSTIIEPYGGTVSSGSGTSFSSPITAGMVACLWQAHPDLTNIEIMQFIQQSASQSGNPDNLLGYGIPDYYMAHMLTNASVDKSLDNNLSVFPNPFENEISIQLVGVHQIKSVEISDITGKLVYSFKAASQGIQNLKINNLHNTKAGVYFAYVHTGEGLIVEKIIKK